jgi:hypothetical protein
MIGTIAVIGIAAASCAGVVATYRRKRRREQFIRSFMFPAGAWPGCSGGCSAGCGGD